MFDFACLDPNCSRCGRFWDRQLGLDSEQEEEDEGDDGW